MADISNKDLYTQEELDKLMGKDPFSIPVSKTVGMGDVKKAQQQFDLDSRQQFVDSLENLGAATGGASGVGSAATSAVPKPEESESSEESDNKNNPPVQQPQLDIGRLLKAVNFGEGSINTIDNLRQAQEQANKNRLETNMFDSMDLLASSIAGSKRVDPNFIKRMRDQDEIPVQQFKELAEQEKNDPNSPMSQGMRDYAKQFNIELKGDVSAKNIEQILPFISKSYEMDLNRKRDLQMSKERSEDRKLQREMIKTQKDIALGESAKKDYETLTTKFREEAKKGTLGKILDNYNLTEVVSNNMNDFLKDPTGYADYATMLQGLKALQGDQSVVRGEEIRLGMNRGTLLQKAENALDSLFKGEFLQPEQRTAIRATVKAMKENTKKQYIKNSIPLKNQMKRANIKQEDVFQPDFIDLDNNKEKPDEQIEPSPKPISSEVERKTSDGKIAIFDANTKQFLRYK